MRVQVKKVYYCDFCGKHRLRPVTKHEATCTKNPDRECWWDRVGRYWDKPHASAGSLRPTIEWCKALPKFEEQELEELRDRTDGCPACMLTTLRLARPDDDGRFIFRYESERERFNEERQRREAEREMQAAYMGTL